MPEGDNLYYYLVYAIIVIIFIVVLKTPKREGGGLFQGACLYLQKFTKKSEEQQDSTKDI